MRDAAARNARARQPVARLLAPPADRRRADRPSSRRLEARGQLRDGQGDRASPVPFAVRALSQFLADVALDAARWACGTLDKATLRQNATIKAYRYAATGGLQYAGAAAVCVRRAKTAAALLFIVTDLVGAFAAEAVAAGSPSSEGAAIKTTRDAVPRLLAVAAASPADPVPDALRPRRGARRKGRGLLITVYY